MSDVSNQADGQLATALSGESRIDFSSSASMDAHRSSELIRRNPLVPPLTTLGIRLPYRLKLTPSFGPSTDGTGCRTEEWRGNSQLGNSLSTMA